MKNRGFLFQPRNVLICHFLSFFICASGQAPPTLEDVIKTKGIETTTISLRSALHDQRPDVRGLAAAILADRKDIQSVSTIHQVLARATDPFERTNVAQALITFGDPQGHPAMQSVCKDASVPVNLRLTVNSILMDTGDRACIASIPNMLSSISDNSGARSIALEFLISNKPEELMSSGELGFGLGKALQDSSPFVRQKASRCLVLMNVPSARRLLVSTIAKEPDADTRAKMRDDLKRLNAY